MLRIIVVVLSFFLFTPFTHAAPPLEAYGHLPGVELVQLSPSGDRFAFIAVVGESRRLMVVSAKGETIFVVNVGDVKVRNLEWVGEDRILVWSTTTFDMSIEYNQSYEFYSVSNIDLKTRKISNIFASDKNVSHFVFGGAGVQQLDGHDYGYFVGLTFDFNHLRNAYEFVKDHRDLYRVDLSTSDKARVARGGEGPEYRWVMGLDGNVVAHSIYSDKDGRWRLYAGADEKKLLLEKVTPFGDLRLIGRGHNPDTVWISDGSSGITVTEEISLVDGKRETLFDGVNINGYLSDPVAGNYIGATTVEDPHAIFLDGRLQARMKATRKAFPNLQVHLVSYSKGLDRIIVKTDGGDDSGTYWMVNIATGQADPIGRPYPEIRAADVGPTQMIDYKAGDGLSIDAVLTLPPGRKPEKLPLVVLPHGGPIDVSDAIIFDWWAQAYASAGYAVLQPNYRGSGGHGKEFLQAGYGQWGRKMQTDLSDGVAALAAQGVINPKRVCIVGASYGGYAALAGVTLQHDIYRCAVSVAGPADLPELFRWEKERHGRVSDDTRYWRAVTGADQAGDAVMKTISPTYLAGQVNAPILLIHGKDDTVVPIEQSRLMESALKGANKPVEFIEMPGEDHWLSREETRKAMLKASVEFVRKYNPPD